MDAQAQAEIWSQHTQSATVKSVMRGYRNPCAFQREFADYVNRLGAARRATALLKICEMGSEFGVTLLLVSEQLFERHALDLNPHPLELLSQAAVQLGQKISTHRGDMFKTEWPDGTFDFVFNNGVLEHYSFHERVAALREFARVTRPGGLVIIGVPNHCSCPYRCAYLLRRAIGRWNYPPEKKIKHLSREIAAVGSLRLSRKLHFDQEAVFTNLPKPRITSVPFRWLHRWFPFEPYLRVFEMVRS